jgi:hypothetical protein
VPLVFLPATVGFIRSLKFRMSFYRCATLPERNLSDNLIALQTKMAML